MACPSSDWECQTNESIKVYSRYSNTLQIFQTKHENEWKTHRARETKKKLLKKKVYRIDTSIQSTLLQNILWWWWWWWRRRQWSSWWWGIHNKIERTAHIDTPRELYYEFFFMVRSFRRALKLLLLLFFCFDFFFILFSSLSFHLDHTLVVYSTIYARNIWRVCVWCAARMHVFLSSKQQELIQVHCQGRYHSAHADPALQNTWICI